MSGYHSLHASRRDDGDAVRFHLPIHAADFDNLYKGHQAMIILLRRSPASLAISLVSAAEVRYLPADYDVREVPLLIGPEAHKGG
jgi:hypothetical protein